MQWVRGPGYTVKEIGGEIFLTWATKILTRGWLGKYEAKADVTALSQKDKRRLQRALSGPETYDLEKEANQDFLLLLLNATTEERLVSFARQYGPLGILWVYKDETSPFVNRSLKSVSLFSVAHPRLRPEWSEQPSLEFLRQYAEPVRLSLDAAQRLRRFALACIQGRPPEITLNGPAIIHYSNKKPYWLPQARTPLELAYSRLPMLLAEGIPLRLCNCGEFFIHRKKIRCPDCDSQKNAAKQKEVRKLQKACRLAILKGYPVGVAAQQAGVSIERVENWLARFADMQDWEVGERLKTTRYEAIKKWQEEAEVF